MPTINSLKIYMGEAASSLDKTAQSISKGSVKTRIGATDDSRFHIAARLIQKSDLANLNNSSKEVGVNNSVVEVKIGDNQLLIEISSLMKRLHLKKKEIFSAVAEGRLPELIEQQTKHIRQSIQQYETLVKTQTKLEAHHLDMGIPSAVLLKQAKKATKLGLTTLSPTFYIKPNTDLPEFLGFTGQKLGRGGFGKAHLFYSIEQKAVYALKYARQYPHAEGRPIDKLPEIRIRAQEDIENENYQLFDLHEDEGPMWGIQDKPTPVAQIILEMDKGTKQKVGFLGTHYTEDYANYLDDIEPMIVPFKSRLLEVHQLFSALQHLYQKDYLHGDIKPGNILCKKAADGTIYFHLADWGSARHTSRISSPINLAGAERSFTYGYSLYEDLILSREMEEQAKKLDEQIENRVEDENVMEKIIALMELRDKLIDLERKRDVFSFGMLLYVSLSKEEPYQIDAYGYPHTKSGYRELPSYIPQEMNSLIKQMLDPDYTKRPLNGLEQFEAFLTAHYPNEFVTIQQKMKNFKNSLI